eukprot:678739_1
MAVLFLMLLSILPTDSFSDIDSGCSIDIGSTATCATPSRSSPFSCTSLSDDRCGCNQQNLISNVFFLIDNTGFINDYSWYYWSIQWIDIYQSKILIHQPSMAPYVRYIHIGNDSSDYIITPATDSNGDAMNPHHIFNSWTIPPQYKHTNAPDFCASIQTALDTVTEDRNTVIIYLANSTPYSSPNDTTCLNITNSTQNTSIYMLRSSPNVHFDSLPSTASKYIKLEATMIEEYKANITDNWGSTLNQTAHMIQPNYKLVHGYMNDIVATASDFICNQSYLCDSTVYKSLNSSTECMISCESTDQSCITNVDSSKYYIMKRLSGMMPSDMSQSAAHQGCNTHFGSSLASIKSEQDAERITQLMSDLNVDECWIGMNDTSPVFTSHKGISYYQWMDGNVNALSGLTFDEDDLNNSDSNVHCASISNTGEVSLNECDQEYLSCAICNVMDDPILTISDDRHYLVFTDSNTKTWEEADDFCVHHFGTHLSTVQSMPDEQSVYDNANQIGNALQTLQNMSLSKDLEIWIGTKIIISYDECIDYWNRKFNIISADGSHYNYSLINLMDIVIDTCTPTAAPTFSPTRAPTNAPTYSPTRSPSSSPTAAPTDSPTQSPTLAPTQSPTRSPTDSTKSPTQAEIPTLQRMYSYVDDTYWVYEEEPPVSIIVNPPVDLTLRPTSAPTRTRLLQNPLEPSQNPTLAPTSSPVYASDQCFVLNASPINANHSSIEYDYTWRTADCDATFLSMFSCNRYDRASYHALDTNYFLLIDEDGKTWKEANEYCQHVFGTSLATVYDTHDQNEIIGLKDNLIQSNDIEFEDQHVDDIWIGMKLDDGKISKLSWSDQSTSNYSNLISGCLAMDNNNASLWNIELCDGNNVNHIWSCNNFVPTPRPTVSPTLFTEVTHEKPSMFERITAFIIGHPFEIIYCTILFISLIITLLAWIHAKSGTCCWGKCDCFGYSQSAKYVAALIFGLQLWDFLSDVSFAYNLPNKSSSSIFYLSVLFIIVPWTINIVFLLLFRYRWANNREVASWLREHTVKLVGMTMVCGGAQPSIELANSRIFGLEVFSMGLSRYQLIQSSKFKVLLTTMLENIPQILITTYYMISIHQFNDFAVASLISSSCSVILVIVATILMRADNLVDEPMEIVLHYRFATKNKKQRNKLSRIGLHESIARAIASAIERNQNMVFVDKHTVSLKTVTFNVSITSVRRKEEMMEEMEEGEEELISKTSVLYGLEREDCKRMVDGIMDVIELSRHEIRLSKMEMWPLDYNGARGYVSKVAHFDRHHKVNQTKWEFPDNPLLAQHYQLLNSEVQNTPAGRVDNKATDEDSKEEEEQVGLLIDSD